MFMDIFLEIIRLLKSDENIDLLNFGPLFVKYVEARKKELNIIKPFKLYFSKAVMVKQVSGSGRVFKTFDALTGKEVNIGISARGGGNNEKEMFSSVDISGKYNSQTGKYEEYLSPLETRKTIIKLLFTIEHELRHEKQREELKNVPVTGQQIKLSKSMAFFDFWKLAAVYGCAKPIVDGKEVDPEYMYVNTHEHLFIEQDAHAYAYEVLSGLFKQYEVPEFLELLNEHYKTRLPNLNQIFEASFFDFDDNSKKLYFKGTIDDLVEYCINYYSNFSEFSEKYPFLKSGLNEDVQTL